MAKNKIDCFFDDMIDPTFGINDSFTLTKCKRACSESSTRTTPTGGVDDDNTSRRRTGVRRGQIPSNSSAKVGSHNTGTYYVVMTKQHDGSATSKSSDDS
mmetsp:Transcript_29056/g.69212  ORF Transcript_29056/g.69212 Transcript_29056/m.69212 type:complete len:100 (-) Transcript_29056:163-462(-)